MAAKLNLLGGAASTAQVDAALAWATSFFTTYTPSSSLSKAVREQAIAYAGMLDDYNNGKIGPGTATESERRHDLREGPVGALSVSAALVVGGAPLRGFQFPTLDGPGRSRTSARRFEVCCSIR